jgi:hypothetical protein
VARHASVQEHFDELEIAEDNLNLNINNSVVLQKYIAAVEKVREYLNDNYSEYWSDPALN